MLGKQDQLRRAESGAQADSAAVAPPCAMVIFGAAGDLTKRLIVPALYNLVNAKRLSNGFQLVGVDLAAKTAEEWRKGLTDTMQRFVAQRWRVPGRPYRPDRLAMADRSHELSAGRPQRSGDLPPAGRASGGAGQDSRHRGQPPLLPRRRGPLLQRGGRRARGRGPGDGKRRPMAPGSDRKALRPRPALGQSAQCRDPEDAAGASDLPDGPFPRQGNGPEHHGAALCQRSVRAAVESRSISTTSRSPRRRPSGSSTEASSTRRPGRCATWCPTTCSSCWR